MNKATNSMLQKKREYEENSSKEINMRAETNENKLYFVRQIIIKAKHCIKKTSKVDKTLRIFTWAGVGIFQFLMQN